MSGSVSRRSLIGAGAALALLPRAASATPGHRTAQALAGTFLSKRNGSDPVAAFLGIRYGTAARFRAPVPAARGAEPVSCDQFGPVAPQPGRKGDPQSEDCLYLNVWTRFGPREAKPVMVYFHGGAYSNGSVTDPLTQGHRLAAAKDVVVVTVNHRLNAFGYLYLARFDPRFADSGNLGQLDLILALRWVRANIAAFGGDPGRVLVFGQSGGGAKIATLMGMPAAEGLFHRAITMSGQQVTVSGPLHGTERARAFLGKLRVADTNLAPLLEMPVEQLLEGLEAADPILGGSLYMAPVLDMKWLTRHPFWPDANPQSNRIPMMLGNTHDETRAFIRPDSAKVAGLDWRNLAERMASELKIDVLPEWVVAQYRAHFPAYTPEQLFYAATTAGRSWRGQVIEADARAVAGAPTWVYQVDFKSPTMPQMGAPHTMDIALAFGTLDAPGSLTGTGATARATSATLMSAFAAFAANGDPTASGLPDWPAYTVPCRTTMLVDAEFRAADDPRRWERELFARVPYVQPGS